MPLKARFGCEWSTTRSTDIADCPGLIYMTPDVIAPAESKGPEPTRDGSGDMFDAIAARYDFLNRVLSLGIDQGWRRRAVQALELPSSGTALDLATGTADLALRIAESHSGARVTGLDPSAKMLDIGKAKVASAGLSDRVVLVRGVAEELPFEDRSFDAVSMAFGIRNVPDRPRALREMARVTRDAGRIAILELSEPTEGWLGPLARFHVRSVVPWVGGVLSGAHEYRYLQRSIAAFPPPSEFRAVMEAAGLEVLESSPLTFGVCHLYVARPRRPS